MPNAHFQTFVFSSLGHIGADWDVLFEHMTQKSPFLSRAWFALFEQQVPADGDQVFYIGVLSDGVPHLLLPVWQPRPQPGLRPRVAQGLANFYSCFFEPLWRDGPDRAQIFDAAVQALMTLPAPCDLLLFTPLDPASPAFDLLQQALARAGLRMTVQPAAANWYEPLDGRDFEAYFNGLPKKMRGTIKRQEKKLAEQFRIEFRLFSGIDDLDTGVADYDRVYANSWKGSESYPAFMPAFIRMLAQQGWLRLGLLYFDGQPVAAQLWLVSGGVAYIYKMSYDQSFADHGVGNQLAVHMWRQAIDVDGVHTVDYLSGDEPYKKLWMDSRRERYVIEAVKPWTLRGQLLLLKRRLKRLRQGAKAMVAAELESQFEPKQDAK